MSYVGPREALYSSILTRNRTCLDDLAPESLSPEFLQKILVETPLGRAVSMPSNFGVSFTYSLEPAEFQAERKLLEEAGYGEGNWVICCSIYDPHLLRRQGEKLVPNPHAVGENKNFYYDVRTGKRIDLPLTVSVRVLRDVQIVVYDSLAKESDTDDAPQRGRFDMAVGQ